MMRAAIVVPDQLDAMDALSRLREAEVPVGLVHDEYGHLEGIVTPADLLIAIAGEFASDADPEDSPNVVERDDGSLLVNGQMPADQLAERLGLELPEDRDYATVAGLALAVLRHLPQGGRELRRTGLAVRDHRPRRAADRQIAGAARRSRACAARKPAGGGA